MNSYLHAKLLLFNKILNKGSIIITDKEIKPFNHLQKISNKKKHKILDIEEEVSKIKIFLPGLADFKLKNLAMATISAKICGLKDKEIYKQIKNIKDVSGRLELVKKYQNNVRVFVDYAHTPDALSKTLKFLKKENGKNISLVFGCGGDRDKKKRPLMARIANNYCKKIYVTDDNPRNENPEKIRKELLKNISPEKYFNIAKRSLAIQKSIKNADTQEVILVAGKGHEESQIYKNKIFQISDKKIIQNINLKIKKKSKKEINYQENKIILSKILKKTKITNFEGISIDTRLIKKNNLFLAIRGKKNNGNDFIKEAFKKGAACVVSDSLKKFGKKILKVNNSISFLNSFAKLKRDNSLAKIIAITGSAGKTSLKNLSSQLLQNFGKTYSSPRSYNNYLGVPISLSNLNYDNKYGLFEVGMSKAGEIRNLSKLIKPHIGVITNIGEAHMENFKSIKGIAKAKSEIIENIIEGGTVILNRDDKFFNFLLKKAKLFKIKVVTFGKNKASDVQLKQIIKKNDISKIIVKINNKKVELEIKDINIYNVLASLALLDKLKIDASKLKPFLKELEPSIGRGKKYLISRYKKKFKLIDESYNANPLSMKESITKLSKLDVKNRKYVLLGDMLELGNHSKKLHQNLSDIINNSNIDKLFIHGNYIMDTYKKVKKVKRGNILQCKADFRNLILPIIQKNDYLMIKGSNATGLNKLTKKLYKGRTNAI